MDILPGLLSFSQWLDEKGKTIKRNAQDLPGLLASFEQDVQRGAAASKSAWDASRSVMPGVREQGIREMNAQGQELGGLLGTFAGVGAKTADVAKLGKAKAMVKAGADPVEVWKQTGWTDQFPDGKWRYEISDDKALLKGILNIDKGISKADALEHPALYSAHPDIKDIPKDVRFGSRAAPYGGSYSEAGGRAIQAYGIDPNDALGIALHEGQHAVQGAEGFARGGNPREMADVLIKSGQEKFEKLHSQADDILKSLGIPGNERIERIRNFNSGRWDFAKADDPAVWSSVETARKLLNSANQEKALAISPTAAHQAYRNLAGEAEARLTQSRMNLTPAERLARPPWLEFDVPREQQIVRGLLGEQTGPAMSVKPTDYRIAHKPMTDEGGAARLHDLLPAFGEDVYGKNALQYFGSGDAREKQILGLLNKVRGKPDELVTIYRGVPNSASGINAGDWVTLLPQVAKEYGPKVVSMKVPARDITSWADSLLEFGYYPASR